MTPPIEDYDHRTLAALADAARSAILGSNVLTVPAWNDLAESGKVHWRKVAAAVMDKAKELARAEEDEGEFE